MHIFYVHKVNTVLIALAIFFLVIPAASAQKFEFLHNRKKETLAFKFIKNLIIIPLEINGKGPYNFVLDTGVGFCIITDPSLIDTLNLKNLRKIKVTGFGEGEDLTARVIPSLQVRIGNAATSLSAAALEEDAFDLSAFTGLPVYGLIGYDFFSSFIIRINYVNHVITMHRQDSGFALRKGHRIPIIIEERKPYVLTKIGYSNSEILPAKLIIDTGAGHPLSLETQAGIPFKIPEPHIMANLGIGITGPINGFLARIDFMKLGKFEIKNVLTAYPNYKDEIMKAITVRRDGSIGNSILRRFNVVFDYSRSSLYLKPTGSLKTPFEHDMSGMELYSSGEGYRRLFVLRVEPESAASEAGIYAGDELLAINLKPVAEISREEIDALFKSSDGKNLVIDIVPQGTKKMERIILTLKRRI